MLTAEKESGQIKAHNYWNQKRYGPLHLQFLSEHRASLEPSKIHRHRQDIQAEKRSRSTNPLFGQAVAPSEVESPSSERPYVIVRRFAFSSDNEPFERMREVTQLQYSHWPDFGAPAHPAHLLGLVEQCDAVVRATRAWSPSGPVPENTRPVLVHCSAGCGRTGTFCTVDSVIDMLKRQRGTHQSQPQQKQHAPMDIDSIGPSASADESIKSPSIFSGRSTEEESGDWVRGDDIDLIERTVEDFRLQRLSMVQSLRQFVLCYETVSEWLAEQTPKSA
jgi:tyrosine-protein phosphatase 2/3